ncbi:uncharacterized protein LOC119095994 [Pollicipes pollicipes]|uniref:uncharacterized protein LOC119095994 n=1 Tax=Pollicipes pollicipes TaxID=41117 RepID=UPI001884DD79|nr:uncharacterized protein LOC119095994 [Pollicipes pollicipes]
MSDKLRSSSDTKCNRRLSGDSWEDLSKELRHSLNRFSSPSFLHSLPNSTSPNHVDQEDSITIPAPQQRAPVSTPPRNFSEVIITTTHCHDICVGPDETQLPNPPTEAPDGTEYEQDRPALVYDGWDQTIPNRIEVKYIPMSLQWFQGRFHDRTEMVGSFKKDCRSWLWKNKPAQLYAFTGDVVDTPLITELAPQEHALSPICEGEREPGQYYNDLEIPSE